MSHLKPTVALVGATGLIGHEILSILGERAFEVEELRVLGREKTIGKTVEFGGESLVVQELSAAAFAGCDLALFVAGAEVSSDYVGTASEAGAFVIDGSSAMRLANDVPLIVPEVNGALLRRYLDARRRDQAARIVASPAASSTQLSVVLKPLLDAAGLKRVVVSTYQSVSGAGQAGMDELWNQTLAIFRQENLPKKKFPHQISFNCIPHIDDFTPTGDTREEERAILETRKILELPELRMSITAVRVPTFVGYGQAVNVELERPLSAEDARKILHDSPGVVVADTPVENIYPVGLEIGGTDATYVGRIRRDRSVENGLNLWIVADNIRKGAALNVVQIAEVVRGGGIPVSVQ